MVQAVQRGPRVLLVDDEPLFLRALERILRGQGLDLRSVCSARDAEHALAETEIDVVLLDLRLGGVSGIDLLARIKRVRPDIEVVVMTGHATVESAVECMRRGAFDYLEKPFSAPRRVREIVARASERRALRCAGTAPASRALIGHSPAIRALARTVASLRDNESGVLIQGEAGTGKEHLALAIHGSSSRRAEPFVSVDCGAYSEAALEREMFGAGTEDSAGGLLEAARGGTLFLADVGDTPPLVQARLLRALQRGRAARGGPEPACAADVRVISASRSDLRALVETGRFRSDLFFRLAVVRLSLPPLRERAGDIPLLARHFLARHRRAESAVGGFEPDALRALARRHWPGNVRELEHAIEAALATASGAQLSAADLPQEFEDANTPTLGEGGLPLSFEAYERSVIERALGETNGDATLAARRLGVGRSTLYRKLAKHGLGARRSLARTPNPPAPR